MARRYVRDARGRFARTSGRKRAAAQATAHATAGAIAYRQGRKTTAALHGAKLATGGTKRALKVARRRAKNSKQLQKVEQAESIVIKADRAVNIALLTAYIGTAGGSRIATKGAQKTLNKLQQEQQRRNPGNGLKWSDL